MSVQGVPTKSSLLIDLKVEDTKNIPQLSSATQSIFKEMGGQALNKSVELNREVSTLESGIENARSPACEKAEIIFRWLLTAASVGGIVAAALFMPVLIGFPLIAYTACTVFNADMVGWPTHSWPLVLPALVISPLLPISELYDKWNNDPAKDLSDKQAAIKKQLSQLGEDFADKSKEVKKKIRHEVKALTKRAQTHGVQGTIQEYETALKELKACKKYYKQFREEK